MPKPATIRSRRFTILLIEGIRPSLASILPEIDQLDEVRMLLRDGERNVEAVFYFDRRSPRPPDWARFFGRLLEGHEIPRVVSSPAVLLVPVHDRTMAVTFLRGSNLLRPDCVDPTFGLRVALNCLDPSQVRSYDKRSFDALFRQTREQASNETSLDSFGIDPERDLVRSVSGKLEDASLGTSMTGGKSLSVSTKVSPDTLVPYLHRVFHKSAQEKYLSEYPWLGRVKQVTDSEEVEILDSFLDDELASENFAERVLLSAPEIVDWSECAGFRFILPTRSKLIFPDMSFDGLKRAWREPISVDLLKRQRVEMLNDNHDRVRQWSLYACLNAELLVGDDAFVLSSGTWYSVDTALLSSVDDAAENLAFSSLCLPEYTREDHEKGGETGYNSGVAESFPDQYCCLHNHKIYYGGGGNQFEICDLLASTGDMLHVKRYGGSSSLSHLFAQGLVATTLLMDWPDFRQEADRAVSAASGSGFHLPEGSMFVERGHRKVIYAIIGGPANRVNREGDHSGWAREIPLFSRINLNTAKRKIEGYGWQVQILFVRESEGYRSWCKIKH